LSGRPSAERPEDELEEELIQPEEITVQNPLSQKAEPVLTPLGKWNTLLTISDSVSHLSNRANSEECSVQGGNPMLIIQSLHFAVNSFSILSDTMIWNVRTGAAMIRWLRFEILSPVI
jgi:hypothetical protein